MERAVSSTTGTVQKDCLFTRRVHPLRGVRQFVVAGLVLEPWTSGAPALVRLRGLRKWRRGESNHLGKNRRSPVPTRTYVGTLASEATRRLPKFAHSCSFADAVLGTVPSPATASIIRAILASATTTCARRIPLGSRGVWPVSPLSARDDTGRPASLTRPLRGRYRRSARRVGRPHAMPSLPA